MARQPLRAHGKSRALTKERLVDLGRKNEIILAESVDLVRIDLNVHLAPGEMQIGMMTFLFCKQADTIHEFEPRFEIPKQEGLGEMVALDHFPERQLIL